MIIAQAKGTSAVSTSIAASMVTALLRRFINGASIRQWRRAPLFSTTLPGCSAEKGDGFFVGLAEEVADAAGTLDLHFQLSPGNAQIAAETSGPTQALGTTTLGSGLIRGPRSLWKINKDGLPGRSVAAKSTQCRATGTRKGITPDA
jgi:hypothetical protein